MKKLTIEFSEELYASKDGAPTPPEVLEELKWLHQILHKIRTFFNNADVYITSGYRSPSYNKKVGGVRNSMHLKGKAADIIVDGVNTKQVYSAIKWLQEEKAIPDGGIGLYPTFVHVDTRGKKVRWKGN